MNQINKYIAAISVSALVASYFLSREYIHEYEMTQRHNELLKNNKKMSGIYIRRRQYFPSPLFQYFKWILPCQYSLKITNNDNITNDNITNEIIVHYGFNGGYKNYGNYKKYKNILNNANKNILTDALVNIVDWFRNKINKNYTLILEKYGAYTGEKIIPIECWLDYYKKYYEYPDVDVRELKIMTQMEENNIDGERKYFKKLFRSSNLENEKYEFDSLSKKALLQLIYLAKKRDHRNYFFYLYPLTNSIINCIIQIINQYQY